ncbi:MAG TPA: GAF domain-containing sensor histidine kinase, partial [Pyrinomonadaceae bacterium]|nr:GAF domain-containing sensor histidine kinase [Pyrinomonadaceae bacterium]
MMLGHHKSISVEICLDEKGKPFVRNKTTAIEVVSKVESGHHAVILGARHNQKSLLLKDIKNELTERGWRCVLVDLLDLINVEESDFLNEFARRFERQRAFENIQIENPPRLADVDGDPESLQAFLENYTREVPKLILLVDHLESIQNHPLKCLLEALTGFHNIQHGSTSEWRIVLASSANLPSSSESISFLDLSHSVWISDMTLSESRELIRFIMKQKGVVLTSSGEQRLFAATKGDRYLLPILAEHCASLINNNGKEGDDKDANNAVTWFVETWAKKFPPLRGNVRAVARDTIALMNVCKVLAQGTASERELMLDHKNDVYELRLTGVISENDNETGRCYSIKNEFYQRYLKDNFRPEHLPHILSMADGWENALHYLNRLVTDFPQYRPDFVDKAVGVIHRARDESAACEYLINQASKIYSLAKAKVYTVIPVRSHLRLRGHIGFDGTPNEEISLETDLPEVKAYKTRDFWVDDKNINGLTILVPLLRNDGKPLGVFGVYGFDGNIHEENFLELLAYCKRAGRAVGAVVDRERRWLQLEALTTTGQEVTSSLDRQKVMQATVDAAIRSVPGAQRAALFIWNEEEEKLVIEAIARPEFFEDKNIKDVIKLPYGKGYAGRVFATGEPLSIGNVSQHEIVHFRAHPDIMKQKSVLSVPLKVWGHTIGVLSVDNIAAFNAFKDSDTKLLLTFAAQAAIALQNAQLFAALKKSTNDSDTPSDPEKFIEIVKRIFIDTVQSITRITEAKAAHMLLLRDIDDESIAIADKKELSESVGLGDDYDEKIKPRPDGLAFQVLRDRRYHTVSTPDDPPGINPLAAERGTKAYICLPMEVSTKTIGVLFVYYMEEHTFTHNEIEMLSIFCNQAALAIENIRQREKLEIMESVTWMGIQFSDMAHSMGTQLDTITMALNTLKLHLKNPAAAFDRIEKLNTYMDHAYAILKSAPLPFSPTPTDLPLNATLKDVIKECCPEEEKIEQSFEALSNDEITVTADKDLLTIVLRILTTNAVTAMRSVPRKQLIVSSAVKSNEAVVTITNTGKEIPKEVQGRIAKKPIIKTPGASGTGVGLLIAKSILLRSGGDLKLIHSNP